jgi:excisionase family DNA binding protein
MEETLDDLVAERKTVAERLAELDGRIILALAERSAPAPALDLLTAEAASRRLGISKVYLCELARLGTVPSVRIGRAVRFEPTDLEAFAATR